MSKRVYQITNDRGSLSITALWLLSILSLIAMGLVKNVMVSVQIDHFHSDEQQAAWLARAGFNHALSILKADTNIDSLKTFDSLNEMWAESPTAFRKIEIGNGYFEVGYFDKGPDAVFGLCDENRKLNLNKAEPQMLAALPGMTPEKLAAIFKWKKGKKPVSSGIKESANSRNGKTSKTDMKNFRSIEELLLIKGITAKDLNTWRPFLTVFGDGRININTAYPEVLQLLGLSAEAAKAIIALRSGPDAVAGTEDDKPFQTTDAVFQKLQNKLKIREADQILLQRLILEGYLTVDSKYFTIQSTGYITRKGIRHTITATVERRSSREIKIVGWSES